MVGHAQTLETIAETAGPRRPWWNARRRRALLLFVLLAPSLVIFLLYRLIPLGWNAVLSFQFWSLGEPAKFAGIYHYEEMFLYDDVFWEALSNTLYFMLSAVIGIAGSLDECRFDTGPRAVERKSHRRTRSGDRHRCPHAAVVVWIGIRSPIQGEASESRSPEVCGGIVHRDAR